MKKQVGITLIALIITIIVMIILVAVVISVSIQEGLFEKAANASNKTQKEADKEELLSAIIGAMNNKGEIVFNKIIENLADRWTYSTNRLPCVFTKKSTKNSFTVLKDGTIIEGEMSLYQDSIDGLDEGVTVIAYNDLESLNDASADNTYLKNLGTNLKEAVDDMKISAVLKETINEEDTIAVIPEGFTVSTADTEDSIREGLVLRDGANEYVWMPYTNSEIYEEDDLGPLTGRHTSSGPISQYDTQDQLDRYYVNLNYIFAEDEELIPFFDIADFTYVQDRVDIQNSINKYRGFLVGRFETTITDTGIIGCMPNENVLNATMKLPETNNEESRWYGLYKMQKDLYANDEIVFSRMITSQEWDYILSYIDYEDGLRTTDTYTTTPDKSGARYKDSNPAQYDVKYNIYDLAGNLIEKTLTKSSTRYRIERGGYYSNDNKTASNSNDSSPLGAGNTSRK